jgi:hypothetical protein
VKFTTYLLGVRGALVTVLYEYLPSFFVNEGFYEMTINRGFA